MGKHENTPRDRVMELMDDAGYRRTWVADDAGLSITAWHAGKDRTAIVLVKRAGGVDFYHEWGSGAGWQSLEDWLRAGNERVASNSVDCRLVEQSIWWPVEGGGRGVSIIDHPDYGRILLVQGEREDGVMTWVNGTAIRLLPRDRLAILLADAGSVGTCVDLDPTVMSGKNPYRPLIPLSGECIERIIHSVGL